MNTPISETVVESAPLTEEEVRQFVNTWYAKLDIHPPAAEMLPMLADEELQMRLPETILRGQTDFINWYNGVIHRFFNEVHVLKEIGVRITPEQADVHLVLNWQASIWEAPAPKSVWVGFDATQSWVLKRSKQTQQPMIVTYIVEKFVPMAGSAPLPA